MPLKIRRNQLTAPFGVGAIYTDASGVSMLIAGLNHAPNQVEPIYEPRLSSSLGVGSLRAFPPAPAGFAPGPHWGAARFPRWHQCVQGHLQRVDLQTLQHAINCATPGCGWRLRQVRFVAACTNGHVQDFPFVEWVHRGAAVCPAGNVSLKLTRGVGGGTLGDVVVKCSTCGASRNLAQAGGEGRISSSMFGAGQADTGAGAGTFPCQGHRPWIGGNQNTTCSAQLTLALRNATNTHFPLIASAIYLPPEAAQEGGATKVLVDAIRTLRAEPTTLAQLIAVAAMPAIVALILRGKMALDPAVSDADLLQAHAVAADSAVGLPIGIPALRTSEYPLLGSDVNVARELIIDQQNPTAYSAPIIGDRHLDHWLAGVGLVRKLRETRVMYGFTRMKPRQLGVDDAKRTLWSHNVNLQDNMNSWLPANVVRGEGIFLQFRTDSASPLRTWEQAYGTANLPVRMRDAHATLQQELRIAPELQLTARFVALHTFAHILIQRLVFDAGYSASALKERLYVSEPEGQDGGMAGILIYTAAGDAEGTLGGLVRCGEAGRLEPTIRRALEMASWCSLDPICMETGHEIGQGTDGCNGAACHACGLLPETSCEHMNRFLDRATLVGRPNGADGLFSV